MKTASVEIPFGTRVIVEGGVKKIVPVNRLLIYDYEARAQLHDLSGTYFSATPSLRVLRDMLWACLRSATLDENLRETSATLSRAQVGEILSEIEDDPERIAEMKALQTAMEKVRDISEPVIQDPLPANP